MECLHWFCQECIEKSMRMGYGFQIVRIISMLHVASFSWESHRCWSLWSFVMSLYINWNYYCRNKECPACRKHCPSRHSLRDNPKFDALIPALFKDIDSYDKEVNTHFHQNTYFFCLLIYDRLVLLIKGFFFLCSGVEWRWKGS